MKKIISVNIKKELADKLETMSGNSFPHVSKSAIVEYALEKVDMTNFIQGDKNGSEEKTSSKKETSKKRKEVA